MELKPNMEYLKHRIERITRDIQRMSKGV